MTVFPWRGLEPSKQLQQCVIRRQACVSLSPASDSKYGSGRGEIDLALRRLDVGGGVFGPVDGRIALHALQRRVVQALEAVLQSADGPEGLAEELVDAGARVAQFAELVGRDPVLPAIIEREAAAFRLRGHPA